MTANGWIQILFFFVAILAVTAPLGAFMYRVLEGERHFLRAAARLARAAASTALGGVDGREQTWPTYALGAARLQRLHAARHLRHPAPAAPAAASTRRASARSSRARPSTRPPASRPTPTGRATRGESTMSYLTPDGRPRLAQLHLGRGGHRAWRWRSRAGSRGAATARGPGTIGNFWVDLMRATVYVLLPISRRRRAGLRLAGRDPEPRALPRRCTTARGRQADRSRMGPVASQEAIKQLGTNGGGFFNANARPSRSRTRRRSRTSSRCC